MGDTMLFYMLILALITFAISLLLIIRTVKKTDLDLVKSIGHDNSSIGVGYKKTEPILKFHLGAFPKLYEEYVKQKGISVLLIIHVFLFLLTILCAVMLIKYGPTPVSRITIHL